MSRTRYSAASHVGRKRSTNEDRVLSLPEQDVWLVADGMGGHAAGEFASQVVVDCVATTRLGDIPEEKMRTLRSAINTAHRKIQNEAAARKAGSIGATVALLSVSDTKFFCLWAGDSRLYRLRNNRLLMLTEDHSVVADLVKLGELNCEEAKHHPQSNVVTRAVGVGDKFELDSIAGSLQSGDRFVLCTDGLSNHVDFETIRNALVLPPVKEAADLLVRMALERGSTDNISAVVVDVI